MKDRIALIRSRLARLGIKNISNEEIKAAILKHCSHPNDGFTEEEKQAVVDALRKKYQPADIIQSDADGIALSENAPALNDNSQDSLLTISSNHPAEIIRQPEDSVTTITPQEAVEIIQEIAEDDSSRNKALAQKLLEQAHEKTDAIVSLVAAMPEIESEMLKRKLQRMPRKQVNYEGVLDSYFQQSQGFTRFVSDLAAEYGVTL